MRTSFLVFVTALAFAVPLGTPAGAQEADDGPPAPAFQGSLRFDGEPVAGVTVVVEQDGEEVDTAVTDDAGDWAVPVPDADEYSVTLDTETLPEGVDLRNPDRQTLTLSVNENQVRTAVFALGERTGQRASSFDRFVTLTVDGVKFGSIIALASLGLSLIFGITGLINFAHGELVTFGALVAWFFNASAGGPEIPLVYAAVVAMGAGALLGAGLEKGLWRSLRRRKTGRIQLFVISIGLALFIRHILLLFFGANARPYAQYALQEQVSLGPISLPPRDFVIILISLTVLATVGLLLQKTRLGTAMRAVADNRDLAEASGIDVQRIILATWVVGTALACLGGVFQGLTEAVRWNMGFNILLLMFAGVILGGLGTAYGAMVGGLLVGMVVQTSTFWFSTEFKLAFALGVMALMLLVRPQGLLGHRERIG